MTVRYINHSKYLSELEGWLSDESAALAGGSTISRTLEPRSGFTRQEASMQICTDNADFFETDWRWKKTTFPNRLKVLATALKNLGICGEFHASHHDSEIVLRRVTQPRSD